MLSSGDPAALFSLPRVVRVVVARLDRFTCLL